MAACGPVLTYPAGAPRIYSDYLDRLGCRHGIFGGQRDSPHSGVDIEVPLGHSVLAAADGVVIFTGLDCCGGGQTITIEHGQDDEGNWIRTVYLHNEENLVAIGQKVRRGELIARAGKTGHRSGDCVHLHFGVYRGKTPHIWDQTWRHVNPNDYWLDGRLICFDASKQFPETQVRFTYPVACNL